MARISRPLALGAIAFVFTVQGVSAKELGVPAMPEGVQVLSKGTPLGVRDPGVNLIANYSNRSIPILADENGMPLYTFDKDENDKSNCADQCAQAWPPLLAPSKAKAFGEWNVVARADGGRQWAFKHKPLYRFAKDTVLGNATGEGDSWKTVAFAPNPGIKLPSGIVAEQLEDAGGVVLVNHMGRTLYAYSGKPGEDSTICSKTPCASSWTPVSAPSLATNIGDFTKVRRGDGSDQWAYQGLPLYSFDLDEMAGQINGYAQDKRWEPALVVRFPTPAELGVTLQWTNAAGLNFATSKGRSLYRQYLYYYSVAGHDERKGYPYKPFAGRALGGKACEDDCREMWEPLKASANAKPIGLWSVVARPDGSKQWAYREHALYTYKDDKKPGDLLGVNTWMISINDPELGFQSLFQKLNINAEIMSGIVFTSVYP